MQLSVIILNYNVRYFLELCLHSVQKALKDIDAEIIVVDNNSPDDSCKMVKHRFPDVQLIENKENVGFAKANNQAVKIAKGTYVCILNPDTVVTEQTFINCIKKAKVLPNLGIMGVRLLDGKGNFLPESKRNLPTPKVSLLKIFGSRLSSLAPYYATSVEENSEGNVSILVGAFMFVEKIKYEEAGGFDERYFMYGEDIDFSYTMQNLGYDNYYLGTESIIHFKGESSFKNKVYKKRFFGAMKLFYKKHFNSSFVFNSIVHLGIFLASFKKNKNSIKRNLVFSKAFFVGTNALLNDKIANKVHLTSEIISAEALVKFNTVDEVSLCFLDMSYVSYLSAVQCIANMKEELIYFRFILEEQSFAVGSDTSDGLGIVISY